MHDFVSYLFYLLQRGMRFAVPAALVCGLILAVCYAVCRRQGRRILPFTEAALLTKTASQMKKSGKRSSRLWKCSR